MRPLMFCNVLSDDMIWSAEDLLLQGEDPTALSILIRCIKGKQFVDQNDACSTCGSLGAVKKCSACKLVNTGSHCKTFISLKSYTL